jgi:hypothetical protein
MAEPSEIIVCFTRSGEIAHALHPDCKTVLGPWINFASAETLEKALRYLGATDEQIDAHRKTMQQTGQGSSHIRLLPNREEPAQDQLREALGVVCELWKPSCISFSVLSAALVSLRSFRKMSPRVTPLIPFRACVYRRLASGRP